MEGTRDFVHGRQNLIQGRLVLQLAEVRSIGRADVDDEEVGMWLQHPEGVSVIFGCLVQRGDFGFAEINADRMAGPAVESAPMSELLGDGFGSGIVETHAVDDRLIGWHTKKAWLGIAGLRMPGDAAQLGEAETERGPNGYGVGIFVHASSQAERIWEFEAKQFNRHRGHGEERFERIANHVMPAGPGQRAHGALVNLLRILGKEQGTDQMAVNPTHGLVVKTELDRRGAKQLERQSRKEMPKDTTKPQRRRDRGETQRCQKIPKEGTPLPDPLPSKGRGNPLQTRTKDSSRLASMLGYFASG